MSEVYVNNMSLNKYIKDKIERFNTTDKTFKDLFEYMFSETENVFYEKSVGFKIVKTTYGMSKENILKKIVVLSELLKDVPKNSVIGIAMNNSIDFIENYWTVLACGYNPLLVNLRLNNQILDTVFSNMKVAAVISDKKEYSVKTVLNIDLAPGNIAADINTLQFGTEMYVMSSGTTNNVKCCAYSALELSNQVNDSYYIVSTNKGIKAHYNNELKHLLVLPLYHIFGFAAVYLWFGFFSRTFVELNDMSSQTVVNTIKRHNVTHIFAVPMFWNRVYQTTIKTIKGRGEETYNKFNKALDISLKINDCAFAANMFRNIAFKEVKENLFGDSVQFMISGGSEISKEVVGFFNGIGYHLTTGYGMSEIGITSVELSNKNRYLNNVSVGIPLKSNQYKIEDGILYVNSVSSAKNIICGQERRDRDTWYKTNDLASVIDGHYYINGRNDDVIITSSGENLNPVLYENKLCVNNVSELCIVKYNDTAAIVAYANEYLTGEKYKKIENDIFEKLKELGIDTAVTKLIFTQKPLTDEVNFKLNRTKIAKLLENNELAVINEMSEDKEAYSGELYEKVRLCFAESSNKELAAISYNTDFYSDLGGNSLDLYNLCLSLSEQLKVELLPDECAQLRTVREFIDIIEEKLDNV